MILAKATSFVTRDHGAVRELLVFEHPTAGLQVPAGTVEDGEAPEDAARREIAEETGVVALRLIEHIHQTTQDLPSTQRAVTASTVLRSEPHDDAPATGESIRRGLLVDLEDERGPYAFVSYKEFDLNVTPPRLIRCLNGWAPKSAFGARVVRHFYHFCFVGESHGAWEHFADGHMFRPRWVPLEPMPKLVRGQDVWLESVCHKLIRQPASNR